MTEVWLAVSLVGAATVVIKAAGPVMLGGRPLPPRLLGMVELLAPAVLAALVVTQVFAYQGRLVVDARAAGLVAAMAAVALRAPVIVVVAAAAVATGLVRAVV